MKTTDARTVKPAEVRTTMPPEESRTPQVFKKPFGLQIQCAKGQ